MEKYYAINLFMRKISYTGNGAIPTASFNAEDLLYDPG
jgi:hypothetical protein